MSWVMFMPDGGVIRECPTCHGEGREEHVTGYDPHDGSETGYTTECPTCHGTGEIEDEAQPIECDDDLVEAL